MNNRSYSFKKILAVGLLVFLLVFGISKLYTRFNTALIEVTTNDASNYIKVERVTTGKSYSIQKQTSDLRERVQPGIYTISVYDENGQSGQAKTITVESRESQKISLTVPIASTPDPVFGGSASDIVADGGQMLFISGVNGKLHSVSESGVGVLFPAFGFKTVDWVRPGYGVAQTLSNVLLLVDGGSSTKIPLPKDVSVNESFAYGVSKNGDLYIASGPNIYVGRVGSSDYRKIYVASSDSVGMSVGVGSVALTVSGVGGEGGSVVVVNNSGEVIGKKNLTASNISWSPNGKRLFLSDERAGKIVDEKLNSVAVVPFKHVSSFSWLDNSKLLIGVDNVLWRYDITSGLSQLITSVSTGNTVYGVYPSTDSSQAYFTTRNSERSQIYRVPSVGGANSVNKEVEKLPLVLPTSYGLCTVSYVNFVNPIITVGYPRPDALSNCVGTAKSELKYYGISTEGFGFISTLLAN